jgi:hypothetical protein
MTHPANKLGLDERDLRLGRRLERVQDGVLARRRQARGQNCVSAPTPA